MGSETFTSQKQLLPQTLTKPHEEDSEPRENSSNIESDGRLSEGEILVPMKRYRERAKEGIAIEELGDVETGMMSEKNTSHHVSPKEEETPDFMENKKGKKWQKKDAVCMKWRRGKCTRGKRCRFLHEFKKPIKEGKSKRQEGEIIEDKPKSLHAAVPTPKLCANWYSCCKVR